VHELRAALWQAQVRGTQQHGIQLEEVKLSAAKQGFVLLPWRWVVERSFGWIARFWRLARDKSSGLFTLTGDTSLYPNFDACVTGNPQKAVAEGYWAIGLSWRIFIIGRQWNVQFRCL
jgi:hypothetical protein